MFRAIILPLPVGIAAKRVWDNKLLIWCGDKGGIPPKWGPPPRGPGGPRSPRFTGRPSWHANKGTDIAWLLEDGTGGRGIDPKGAAPGGKSFGRAPTGGLRGCIGLRALGITGGGGRLPLPLLLGGVALLFLSLSLTGGPVSGGRGPIAVGGVATRLTLPLLVGVAGAFMTNNWNHRNKFKPWRKYFYEIVLRPRLSFCDFAHFFRTIFRSFIILRACNIESFLWQLSSSESFDWQFSWSDLLPIFYYFILIDRT